MVIIAEIVLYILSRVKENQNSTWSHKNDLNAFSFSL